MTIAPVAPENLTVKTALESLDFDSSDAVPAAGPPVGQARAMEAFAIAAEITHPGYNLFVMGPDGSGKQAAILDFLHAKALTEPAPWDWVYVNNFASPHQPNAIRMPSGRGAQLAQAMERFIEDVREAIPALLENEENQNRLRAIDEEFRNRPEEAIEEVRTRAAEKEIALVRTPMGFGFAPLAKGEIVKPEIFEKYPKEDRDRREADIKALQEELQAVIKEIPRWDRARRKAIRDLQGEITSGGINAALESLFEEFNDLPEVLEHLEAARRDLIENFHAIRGAEQAMAQAQSTNGTNITYDIDGYGRYKVNSFVSHQTEENAPVVVEDNPTAFNLIGRAEHATRYGNLVTDFSLIKPGALHRANGGYLILDARKILTQPFAWEALKRAIKAQRIVIESPMQSLSLVATVSLEPEPIPLNARVVLVGNRLLFYLLSDLDPDFPDLFKIVADFDSDMERTPDSEKQLLAMVCERIRESKLRPFGGDALIELLRRSVRLAGDRQKLSINIRGLSDLLCEADFLAGRDNQQRVSAGHVRAAIAAQERRLDRFRERDLESMQREIVTIETQGEKIGQVNGLSVLQLGGFSFGRPSRITARVRLGSGKVIDIEREVKLGGPLHSKGILILSGFLAGRYAIEEPLSLSATLVFEQSYGGVDGDSASSAELYCLLSALAEVPLRQDLAVTGSVDQTGRVQAIGGVNEKIEGFFELCKRRGLSGSQGVVIPKSNLHHLVLSDEVVEAVKAEDFQVYAVETIDEGIALLANRDAGQRDGEGHYPSDSINGLVEARLRAFTAARHAFSANGADRKAEPSDG